MINLGFRFLTLDLTAFMLSSNSDDTTPAPNSVDELY